MTQSFVSNNCQTRGDYIYRFRLVCSCFHVSILNHQEEKRMQGHTTWRRDSTKRKKRSDDEREKSIKGGGGGDDDGDGSPRVRS